MIVEIVIIILIFMSVLWKRNRAVFGLILGMMFILMAYSTFNADYNAYMHRYEDLEKFSEIFRTDAGFGALMYLSKFILKLSYQDFIGIVCIISLSIISIAFWKWSEYPCLMQIIYFMLFYRTHATQLRAFISEVLIIYAVLTIIEDNKKIVQFLLLILLASTFHYTAIFYFAILVPLFVKKKRTTYTFTVLVMLMMPFLYTLLLRFSPASAQLRMDIYFGNAHLGTSVRGTIFVLLFLIMTFITGAVAKKATLENESSTAKVFDLVTNFNIVTWISLGLILRYSNNFFRINRPMIIVSILCLLEYIIDKYEKRIRGFIIVEIFSVVSFYLLREILSGFWYKQIGLNALFQAMGIV